MPAAEGIHFACFGKKRESRGRMMPTRPPMTMDQIFTGCRFESPRAMASATPFQVCAAGAGNWSVPSTEASGTSTLKAEHRDQRADEDAGELRDELLARVGAEQVAALEVGEQVGGGAGRRRP